MFNSDAAVDWHGCYDARIVAARLSVNVPFTVASIEGIAVYVVVTLCSRRSCIAPFYVMGVVA